jgi:plastocyanin
MIAALRALRTRRPRRLGFALIGLVLSTQAGAMALGALAHDVFQRNRAFNISRISIARGEALLFENNDQFLHQIYVDAPNLKFESDEQPPGQAVTVTFSEPGSYEVHCHIHPKMGLFVTVE